METVVLANIARELELGVACIIVEDTESASAMQSAFRDAFEAKGGQWRTPVVINPDDESDYEGAVSGCFDS
jgi:ABC-type branched-subunit amino acid transport system substrate-binding protein